MEPGESVATLTPPLPNFAPSDVPIEHCRDAEDLGEEVFLFMNFVLSDVPIEHRRDAEGSASPHLNLRGWERVV